MPLWTGPVKLFLSVSSSSDVFQSGTNVLTSASERVSRLQLEPPGESSGGGERCEVSADPGFELAGRVLKKRTLAAGLIPLKSCSFEQRVAEERGQEKVQRPTASSSGDGIDKHRGEKCMSIPSAEHGLAGPPYDRGQVVRHIALWPKSRGASRFAHVYMQTT